MILKFNQFTIKKIISIGISAIVFIVVLEICTRIDDKIRYDADFFSSYSSKVLHSYDDEGIRFNPPNSRFEKWENNKFGFRGPDFDIEKPKGKTRIMCMGASETYGMFENQGKEWPSQLSDLLEPTNSYQVINASTVGLKRDHILKYLDKYVFKFNPDIIIFFINPSFIDRQPKNKPIKKKTVSKKTIQKNQFTISNAISDIRIFPKMWQMIKKFVPKSLLEKYQYWDISKKITLMEAKFLKGKKTLDSIPLDLKNNFKSSIDSIVTTVQSKGIRVILCTYPYLITNDNLEKYQTIFMENRRFNVELSFAGMIDASKVGNAVIKQIAEERNTGFVDCYSVIPKSTTYFGDNVHLTNKGSEVVAKEIAKLLLQ